MRLQYTPINERKENYNVTVQSGQHESTIKIPYQYAKNSSYTYNLAKIEISPKEYYENVVNQVNSIGCGGNLVPDNDSAYDLGQNGFQWRQIWAQDPDIYVSDIREKHDIDALDDKYSEFFDLLEPVTYKMNKGTSDRKHTGLIANSVKASLDAVGINSKDFAGYVEWTNSDGNISCGLRYGEFIALCIKEIQKLKSKILKLEKSVSIDKNL